jgi:hypothetical protein
VLLPRRSLPGVNPYLEHEGAWHDFHVQFPSSVAASHYLDVSGRYAKFAYDTEPEPPLRPDDAAWARDVLARIGRAGATP